MAAMDGTGHLLTLKVMRVSRPELASAWAPFYSSSPSLSAQSTASIMSLQGNTPLPGHPKTLRDLTHASEFLTLPSSFGSIQLGETFSSCLCVNNEANMDIEAISMKIEMQTTTSKVLLAEFGGPEYRLTVGGTLESVIHHEIKELGQHVLACSVTYRIPPNARGLPATSEDPDNPTLQTFRKFYKFAVTNPLSVKTKVHTPRSPSALMSITERDKVFLEVHIQNLTQEPIHFERMQFECADDWDVEDGNFIGESSLFSDTTALMQPQDMRQYIYILSHKTITLAPTVHAAGSIIPLGRLDISWRSSFGEPGRLLTSMLTRRVPLPPVPIQQPPASALPSYLKRNVVGPVPLPSRPRSPQSNQSRPGTPPMYRPASPSRNSSSSMGPNRPQSPLQLLPPIPMPDIEVHLVVRRIPRMAVTVEEPFTVEFTLGVSALIPPGRGKHQRVLKLVIQHIQAPRATAPSPVVSNPPEALSPRVPSSGFSTPLSATHTFNYALAHHKILGATPRQSLMDESEQYVDQTERNNNAITLPPPYFNGPEELKSSLGVLYVGSSALFLPPIELSSEIASADSAKACAVQDFELVYIPVQRGLMTVGGLRVLLVGDLLMDENDRSEDLHGERITGRQQTQVLKEWDVVGEVWVSS